MVHHSEDGDRVRGSSRPGGRGLWLPLVAVGAAAVLAAACSSTPTAAKLKPKDTTTTSTTAPAPTTTTTAAASPSTTAAKSSAAPATTTTVKAAAHSTTAATSCSTSGGTLSATCDTQSTSATLTGAGANSIQPFFSRVFYYFNQADHGVNVNYSPAGSSVGVTDIEQDTVAFGDSEIPIKTPASGTGGNILQVPVDLGGVALSYNVPGLSGGLKLNGPVLAGIFLGKITKWDDAQIAALNPGVNLPGSTIYPVHRADSSGPGYDLDQYLIDTAGSTWTGSAAGTTASTKWPITNVGVGQQLNTGVATYIQQTQGSIGYVEYAYSVQAGFTNAALLNTAGDYVTPSQTSIAAAGAEASGLSATNFNIVNGAGAGTYPLANFSWTLLYQKQANAAQGVVLGKLVDWVTTTGQNQAKALGYSPLPANVVALAHSTLLQLENSAGKPLFSS
ncbi:MAG TPA: phosphate ABC transporter substrate-binding protein PstS [Acidimicrobiales bacterium]|nr:phosphate ABC transporter substrate-binding protein PstS [Acidimicrobiales bacterium]